MKVSEITADMVADYIKLDSVDEPQRSTIDTMICAAKSYISEYTGIPITAGDDEESLDSHADFWPVVMVLCQDMYDNRALYVEKSNLNKMVETILDMHSNNLV